MKSVIFSAIHKLAVKNLKGLIQTDAVLITGP
jgi:hypothetical protein